MYYSSGNYEAFARPRKPVDVENKTAWFVGSGLAALSRSVQWQGGYGRHRDRKGLCLAAQLDGEPSAALQTAAQGSDRGLGLRAVRREAR